LALTIGRALPNCYQLLVERGGLVYWLISGVWLMNITCSACLIRGEGICLHLTAGEKWLIDNQLNGDDGTGFNDYRESEQTLCGDCLRPDCYHLEQVRGRV
jgi:hypothetical protein